MRAVLFDIDGTLVLTGGAGSRALNRVMMDQYSLPLGTDGVRYDGKTDPQIVREILAQNGQDCSPEAMVSLFDEYLAHLRRELTEGPDCRVLPGVPELIETLGSREDFLLGLATGNLEEGARIKLTHAGLNHLFSFGGFGSDSENRTQLIRIAIERAREQTTSSLQHVFVIGDTPLDIIHGKAAKARTIAVASGNYSLKDLRSHDPDLAVDSIHPLEPVLEFLTSEF